MSSSGRLLLVSNRLPVTVTRRDSGIGLVRSSGGLASALAGVARDRRLWIGWTGTTAGDEADVVDRLRQLGLEPVGLTADQTTGYYDRFANGVIWPVFHYLLDRIPPDSADWRTYEAVNQQFADRVVSLWQRGDQVWVHDYHLMLVPAFVRERLPDAPIGFFLHIPFPALDVFRTLPWRDALVRGMLGADLVGFHTNDYAAHFVDAARQLPGASIADGEIRWGGRRVAIGAFPIGVDTGRLTRMASRPATVARADSIRAEAGGRRILLGVDRLDYTKGIFRRLIAFQRLLETRPALRGRVRFVQIAVPSRIDVQAYRQYRRELDERIGHINGTFGDLDSVPVHYLNRNFGPRQLVALYGAADVMVVTPLRDGMNLVAKEFVAARPDGDGVLVLSEFTGAAGELREALHVNPYDIDAVADAMEAALLMPEAERRSRMRALRQTVEHNSVQRWAAAFRHRLPAPASGDADAAGPDAVDAIARGELPPDRPLILLLDYDGTLVPIAPRPRDASPDPALLNLLAAVASQRTIDLHLVTGRALQTVNAWFWNLHATLWAEHGAACRPRGDVQWHRTTTVGRGDLARVIEIFERAAHETPGALTEIKTTAAAWHFRLVDEATRDRRVAEVRTELGAVLPGSGLELLDGRMVLEVRPRGVSKGAVVRTIRRSAPADALFVAIGDDRTDEEMFAALPADAVTIHVGAGPTSAKYTLPDTGEVRAFAARLAARRTRRPAALTVALQPALADRGLA